MNTRVLVILSLLVGIGAVLHTVVPPVLFGMKPDMLLAMMFLGILLFPKLKYVIILSIATGIISALTTGVPGGQISNIIDKPITAIIFLSMVLLLNSKIHGNISAPILTAIGTFISGVIFLSVALYIVGLLKGGFITLFVGIVIPAAVANAIIIAVVYPLIQAILKRSQPITIS